MQPQLLRLVHPSEALVKTPPRIEVRFALSADVLRADFTVQGAVPRANAALDASSSQWGLWDWDVVELFLKTSSAATYFEFQLSPLNQFFELEILEPRKKMNRDFRSGFSHGVSGRSGDQWSAWLEIPLRQLNWDGRPDSLVGGAFAILGAEPRTYWSLFLPRQDKPDFHLPQHFRPLLG